MLYLEQADNGSGHSVFKLDSKAIVLVNRAVLIQIPQTVFDQINEIWVSENQLEDRIQFTNRDDRVTITGLNLNLDDNNNGSSVSDESFDYNNKNIRRNLKKKVKIKLLQPTTSHLATSYSFGTQPVKTKECR